MSTTPRGMCSEMFDLADTILTLVTRM